MSQKREPDTSTLTDETEYVDEERADEFFALEEVEDFEETRGPLAPKLAAAGIMLVATFIALLLLLSGVRTFNEARANEGYENKSWVIQGTLDDVTRDLQSDKNVAIYTGQLPDTEAMKGKTFVSDVADSVQVEAQSRVKFRGSQTGKVKADFPQKVDGLLVEKEGGQLTVVRTGEAGSLVPVTEDTVGSQKFNAMMKLGGAILLFGAAVVATFFLIRKKKTEF
ncbi:MAG: hypothetical protein Q3965_04900 [Rothia sp. (in: high G+C Gram-positive bacteria)]|nr:hypothetical protein [Rothia sp. (in: high G+C Gram-positive bacteria)]